LAVLLGGSAAASTGAVATPNNLNNAIWYSETTITCRQAGSSNTIFAQGITQIGGSPGGKVNTASGNVNTANALALDFQATWGTSSASNSITLTNAYLEVLN
jgi:hypothetical protein